MTKQTNDLNILTSEQFNQILDAQIKLNVKYSGEDWESKIPDSSMLAAAYAELGELLESGPRVGDSEDGWKWWRPTLNNDDNNLKIEGVDIVHFVVSSIYKKYDGDINLIKEHYTECSKSYSSAPNLMDPDSSGVVYNLLVSMSVFATTCLIKDTSKEETLDMFVYMISAICEFSNMDATEMFEMYSKKNKLNHERIEGGYIEGEYEKYDSDGNEDNTKLFEV